MATSSTIKITPFEGTLENAELNYSGLHFTQVFAGPSANQSTIIHKDDNTGLGEAAANDWPIYDGAGQEANLVSRAQGLHIYAGSWYNTFAIVFEIERFKGSTLQVAGSSIGTSDWAIVGGTGEFEMARGVIKRESQGATTELTIRAFYLGKNVPTLKSLVPTLKRLGPWGGPGGGDRDIIVEPSRLENITIHTGAGEIYAIAFTYLDKDGNMHNSGYWGETPAVPILPTINLAPTEVVIGVSGTYNKLVTSLKFVTNLNTYGPYGTEFGTPFQAPVPKDSVVVGFFASSGSALDRIGVYTI